jgi:hypothetical protein
MVYERARDDPSGPPEGAVALQVPYFFGDWSDFDTVGTIPIPFSFRAQRLSVSWRERIPGCRLDPERDPLSEADARLQSVYGVNRSPQQALPSRRAE